LKNYQEPSIYDVHTEGVWLRAGACEWGRKARREFWLRWTPAKGVGLNAMCRYA